MRISDWSSDVCSSDLLARGDVIYFSPYDNMLAEWTDVDSQSAPPDSQKGSSNSREASQSCLLLVNFVPYARESADLARMAKEQGRSCILVSDDYTHWDREVADQFLYAPQRPSFLLESAVLFSLVLALLVIT